MRKPFPYTLLWLLILVTSCAPWEGIMRGNRNLKLRHRQPALKPLPSPTPRPSPTLLPREGVLLGVYPGAALRFAIPDINDLNRWIEPTGTRVSIAATFMDIEGPDPEKLVPLELSSAWQSGYLPLIKLNAGNINGPRTAREIAEGEVDSALREWAKAYNSWASPGEKAAFLAPLPEMNGDWISYGQDPEGFIHAYHHIQEIFRQEGVSREEVIWVFAPNGWGEPGHEFEHYYPGDNVVDVVGFSAYNFGSCSPFHSWIEYDELFQPYLERMATMAPGKPIFIAEMGTVAQGGNKGRWLRDVFMQLDHFPGLKGILYFNRKVASANLTECQGLGDYRIYDAGDDLAYSGFLEALRRGTFVDLPPDIPQLEAWLTVQP